MTAATYTKQILKEYQNNPLIEALPPIWTVKEAIEQMSITASYDESERELDGSYRMHCIQRLFGYFQPLETHIEIEQKISRCIRQGYTGRNPVKREYAAQMQEGYQLLKNKKGIEHFSGGTSKAQGFSIIGVSGIGKSTAIERILSLYPQCIVHEEYEGKPFLTTQITWLKLDCPHDGSVKGLCFQFFEAIDMIAGTEYFRRYTKARYTVDVLMTLVVQLSRLYHLGLLVIDEIQHLSLAKGGGSDKMLNFFVTLVNTIGIPVVMIGTSRAMNILQSEFRQARRGSGQGDVLWDNMKNDLSWKVFVGSMWRYQWTRKPVLLTDELRDSLYNESQGITDIAVKLYAMAQIDAITNGKETFNGNDVHKVAERHLGLVQPMLAALRSGNKKKIAQYGDIAPLNIDSFTASHLFHAENNAPVYTPKTEKRSLTELAELKLVELGLDPDKAAKLVKRTLTSHPNGTDLQTVVREAFTMFISEQKMDTDSSQKTIRVGNDHSANKKEGLIEDVEW